MSINNTKSHLLLTTKGFMKIRKIGSDTWASVLCSPWHLQCYKRRRPIRTPVDCRSIFFVSFWFLNYFQIWWATSKFMTQLDSLISIKTKILQELTPIIKQLILYIIYIYNIYIYTHPLPESSYWPTRSKNPSDIITREDRHVICHCTSILYLQLYSFSYCFSVFMQTKNYCEQLPCCLNSDREPGRDSSLISWYRELKVLSY